MMFIPQSRTATYTEAMAYRPINLSSLMLKMTEKLVGRHIRNEILRFYPLHRHHFPSQPGKSTETALHNEDIENTVEHREIAVGAFLDTEEVFDSTTFEVIITAAGSMGLGVQFVSGSVPCWIARKLQPHLQEKLCRGL